eukprot:gene22051-biopygen2698
MKQNGTRGSGEGSPPALQCGAERGRGGEGAGRRGGGEGRQGSPPALQCGGQDTHRVGSK